MWPEVFANVWLGVFLGFGLLAVIIAYRKYVVALVSGKHSITGILHYRQRRLQKAIRSVLNEREAAQVRRTAEATALRYVDPGKRGHMAEKLSEKWVRENRAVHRRNGERKK